MESSDHEEHTKALDGPITQYLTHYNKVAGEQTEQVRRWADDDLRSLNGQIEFLLRDALRRRGRLNGNSGPADPEERENDVTSQPEER